MTNRTHVTIQIPSTPPPPPPLSLEPLPAPHTSAAHTCFFCTPSTHRHVHTHPFDAHLLSKSRKKCGQFSKSLPRTLMRFPMAGDLDGGETTERVQYPQPGKRA